MANMTGSYLTFNSNLSVRALKLSNTITNFTSASENILNTDKNTVLINTFSTNVNAWYFSNNNLNKNPFFIYRTSPSQKYFDYLGNISNGDNVFIDYNVSSNNFYHYLVAVKSPDESGKYIIFENLEEDKTPHYIQTTWDTWSLCSIAETDVENQYKMVSDQVWILGNNLESNDTAQNLSITSWNTLGQYAKTSVGKQNYDSGSFSCLLGNVTKTGSNYYTEALTSNNYSLQTEMTEAWKQFISDGNLKLLRDRKGQKWIVQVIGNSTRKIKDETQEQMTVISFEWQEVLNSSNISIINSYSV